MEGQALMEEPSGKPVVPRTLEVCAGAQALMKEACGKPGVPRTGEREADLIILLNLCYRSSYRSSRVALMLSFF
jgi:hypothetical protein